MRVVGKIRADGLYAVITVRFNAVQPQSVSVLTDLLHFGFDLVQSYYHSLSQTQNTEEKSQSSKYSTHVKSEYTDEVASGINPSWLVAPDQVYLIS